jgi:sialate O-acetylesterase
MSLRRYLAAVRILTALAGFLISSRYSFATVALHGIFSDHAVLQRADRVPVWGTAAPGEKISLRIGNASAVATAQADGSWKTFLNLQAEKEGPFEFTVTGEGNQVTLTDILIGEVWLCSGQSNMRFNLAKTTGGNEEAARAANPKIRLLNVGLNVAAEPATRLREKWTLCDPKTAAGFSAVGYYTGQTLQQNLNVPIGLISISWAGTMIETWMSPQALASDSDFKPIIDRWAKKEADYPAKKAYYDENKDALMAAWRQQAAEAKAKGMREPFPPVSPPGPLSLERPSGLYHGEIFPVAPYRIGGVLWYQGEQNVGRAFQYRKLLPALIADWRSLWKQGDFPFVIIQLPNFGKPETQPRSNNFAELREAQALAAVHVPNAALVVTIDAGEEADIHPKDKRTVGVRAGRLIAKDVYHAPISGEVHGPTFAGATAEGSTLRVRFDHATGLKTRDGHPPTDFAIAGADARYVWADAVIQGDTVVLKSPSIPAPVTVRYNWATAPHGNLCNGDGLPAAPFRTDTFRASTEGQN